MDAGGVTLNAVQVGAKAPCPLIANVDGNHTNLGTVLDAMQTDLETVIVKGGVIDLSGTAVLDIVFVADQAYTIKTAKLAYTEVSSADAGIALTVGKLIVGTDDADYFVTASTTEISKEAGYIKALTLAQTAVAAGDIITLTSPGAKSGTGNVVLVLELIRG